MKDTLEIHLWDGAGLGSCDVPDYLFKGKEVSGDIDAESEGPGR